MPSIIIVGTGIAGLHLAQKLKNSKTNDFTILFLEQYKTTGGRMETIHSHKVQYESGAGRIHSSHRELLKLVKEYNLHLTNIGTELKWRSSITKMTEPDNFFELFREFKRILLSLPKEKLQTQTIRDLLIEILGPPLAKNFLDTYPYRSEMEIMRADAALDLFTSLEEGTFYKLDEGFSNLIELLTENLKKQGVKFKFGQKVQSVTYDKKQTYTVKCDNNKTYKADRVVLAIDQHSLSPLFPDLNLLKKVRMEPLLRIYSIYKDASWFPETSIVTDSPLRFIIPYNKSKGLIMSAYLDARDIEPWLLSLKDNDELKDRIQNETQNLFPEKVIPKSLYTKSHLWRNGCSYWLPGNYDYLEASKEALQPISEMPNLHIVGESFSTKQQWIEGALEHANALFELIEEKMKRE